MVQKFIAVCATLSCCAAIQAAPADGKGNAEMIDRIAAATGMRPSEVNPSPVKGLWEVIIDKKIFYTDDSAEHLIIGRIFEAATERDLTSERIEEINRIDISKLPLEDAIKVTYGKGERKIVVFTDTNCPYCRLLEKNLREVGNLTVYNFMYPILRSRAEAQYIMCAENPAAAYLKSMSTGNTDQTANCSRSAVIDRNLELGRSLGITAIPAVIFPSGKHFSGLMPIDSIKANLGDGN